MQLSYFQILVLAFLHGSIAVHAMPTDDTVGLGVNVPKTGDVHKIQPLQSENPKHKRGLPVNIMQNSDESRPMIPVDNYKTDMSRLMGGQE
ncbi:hypothetical protein TRAPUB_7497 [Trametes pubescens]|uniref:Uncharacterized protein n=1 Tax=Trametes pubescens TaxID=154538 RepID=A0A1M2V3A1_TRAPU|nr:hypothetical protein TRAPUB_7497 [Trametes pubescens]